MDVKNTFSGRLVPLSNNGREKGQSDNHMKKHVKISNIKLRYKEVGSEGLMDNFSLEVMNKLRATSRVVGGKCREGLISKICNQNGYITLSDGTTIKPTQARDDKNWFKAIYEDCENKSFPLF